MVNQGSCDGVQRPRCNLGSLWYCSFSGMCSWKATPRCLRLGQLHCCCVPSAGARSLQLTYVPSLRRWGHVLSTLPGLACTKAPCVMSGRFLLPCLYLAGWVSACPQSALQIQQSFQVHREPSCGHGRRGDLSAAAAVRGDRNASRKPKPQDMLTPQTKRTIKPR